MKSLKFLLVGYLFFCASGLVWAQDHAPYLKKQGAVTQLIVNNKPFLMLGGELGNSTATNLADLDRIFTGLRNMNLNTVLVPVSWELIEPQEDKFDFSSVDGIIAAARKNDVKLVLLWFGSWKNTYSSYIPEWVKRDSKRFPRVLMRNGRPTERLTPLNETNCKADAKAFTALMKRIKEVDTDRTVLMIQVQNEVGVIPEPRDFSPEANTAFNSPVPKPLMDYILQNSDILESELRTAWVGAGKKSSGSWTEVFGKDAIVDDFFMAWYYATYIGAICKAGKAEYNIPMFTNAALIRPNYLPGQYNSGGPLPHSMDIYRVGGPDCDFISPDIYFANFAYWGERYSRKGNPLFVPETGGGATGAANVYYAFGQLNAIGFSPFGIEGGLSRPQSAATQGPMGQGGGTAMMGQGNALADAYAVIKHLEPEIVKRQGKPEEMAAIVLEGRDQRYGRIFFGGYMFTVNWSGNAETNNRVGILFIKTGEDEFLVAGSGACSITPSPAILGNYTAGIGSIDEEVLVDGKWVKQRRLNGDQSGQGQVLNISSRAIVYKLRLYKY